MKFPFLTKVSFSVLLLQNYFESNGENHTNEKSYKCFRLQSVVYPMDYPFTALELLRTRIES